MHSVQALKILDFPRSRRYSERRLPEGGVVAAKILLMDSNLRLLSATAERLTHLGYEVATASRVHDAVLKGIVVPPDLVVCDVLMPELNGWEFKRLTAQIPSLAATPVLFLSSQDGLPPEFYDPAAGLVDALKKPASSDAIAAAVSALLARQTARQRLLSRPLSGALPLTDASLVDLCQVMALRAASGVMRLTARAWSAELTWRRGRHARQRGPLRRVRDTPWGS
jgi:DNA-binding response OmpR family regulator